MSLTGGLPTRIGLGTAPISSHPTAPHWWGPQDRDTAVAAVRAAVDAGVGWIDTAPMYGWGRAEEIVADALTGVADRPLVLTKCGTLRAGDGSFYTDNSPAAVRGDVEASLRRLGVEELDLVQVHDEDPAVPVEETWGALHDLVARRAGRRRRALEPPRRAARPGARGRRRSPPSRTSSRWSTGRRRPTARWPGANGTAWRSCRGDRSAPASSPTASTCRGLDPDDLRHRLRWAGADAALTARTREAIATIASSRGCTMVAVALAWLTTRPYVFPIVGARTPAEAVALADPLPVLDADELALLDPVP